MRHSDIRKMVVGTIINAAKELLLRKSSMDGCIYCVAGLELLPKYTPTNSNYISPRNKSQNSRKRGCFEISGSFLKLK